MIGKIFLHVLPDNNFQKPYIKWICQKGERCPNTGKYRLEKTPYLDSFHGGCCEKKRNDSLSKRNVFSLKFRHSPESNYRRRCEGGSYLLAGVVWRTIWLNSQKGRRVSLRSNSYKSHVWLSEIGGKIWLKIRTWLNILMLHNAGIR